ncbi:MAG: DUF4105 domain-containing protein [Deltaproteobacteria bacterium]|nr:DUF4105 domain-containing protein [Deltaproteobacteria bacterium]
MRWLLFVVLWGSGSWLFASADIDVLVARSRALRLSQNPQWKKLLFYSQRWFGPEKSLIPYSDFFLTPRGSTDPQGELEATLAALLDPDPQLQLNIDPPVSRHAQCQFPARNQWLRSKLDFPASAPSMACERLNQFLEQIDSDRVSLVFSSGYMGNPASLFGHTLFRFHRRSRGSALLDHAVGFAATPNTNNPLLYAWRGTAGGFPGVFDVLPYYGKIQEYNNRESRDLWEYELKLSPDQVDLMVKSVWEVGRQTIPYFYLDVNCASVLFVLLDLTDPSFHFAEDIALWVTPTDVARSINSSPGLVTATRFWPSSLTRYLSRFEMLATDEERGAVKDVIKSQFQKMDGLRNGQKARVIDTVLEFIDYTEKMSGEKAGTKYATLRNDLLLRRSRIPEVPEQIPQPEKTANPALSHGSVRVAVGPQIDRFGTAFGFNWRPALHDVLGQGNGFSGDLEIRFLDLDFRALPNSVQLSRLGLLDIVSLVPQKPNMTPFSWRLGILMEEDGAGERVFRKYLRYSLGYAVRPMRSLLVYAMPLIDVGQSDYRGQGFHFGAGLQTGLLWTPFATLRLTLGAVGERRWGGVVIDDLSATASGAFALSQDNELRLENAWGLGGYRVMFSYAHYFWHLN